MSAESSRSRRAYDADTVSDGSGVRTTDALFPNARFLASKLAFSWLSATKRPARRAAIGERERDLATRDHRPPERIAGRAIRIVDLRALVAGEEVEHRPWPVADVRDRTERLRRHGADAGRDV